MFENIFEVLKKPFLSTSVQKPSTIVAEEPDIDMRLATSDYDMPYANNKRKTYNQQEELRKQLNSDIYIKQYRRMSIIPEVSSAVDEIQNEALGISLEGSRVPSLTFEVDNDKVKTLEATQKRVIECWNEIMKLTRFQQKGKDLFRQWYVDGKIVAELIYDETAMTKGIQQILILSPFGFRKVVTTEKDGKQTLLYKYETNGRQSLHGTRDTFKPDQIVYSTSGLKYMTIDVGYLYPAIKAANNLVMIEDSILI